MNLIKKWYRNYSTNALTKYWLGAKKDLKYWYDYHQTWSNPRRQVIVQVISKIPFISLLELGCGSAPNLAAIIKAFPGKQVGGIDINPLAIEVARQMFKGAIFHTCSADNVFSSDKGVDIVLSDMLLIYVGPFKIKKYLEEIKRIGRNWVVLVEYHHESWWERVKLRVFSGRHSYNYRKLLTKMGFYDTIVYKMPKFEEDSDEAFRHIIVARIPKY